MTADKKPSRRGSIVIPRRAIWIGLAALALIALLAGWLLTGGLNSLPPLMTGRPTPTPPGDCPCLPVCLVYNLDFTQCLEMGAFDCNNNECVPPGGLPETLPPADIDPVPIEP
jgi:hypothetical protein